MASGLTLPGRCTWCEAPAVVVAARGRLCERCGADVIAQRRQTEAVRVCAPKRCLCGLCPSWTPLPPAGWRQPPTDSYARRRAELREGRRAA